MKKAFIESYRICVFGHHGPQRRETYKGAMARADSLQKNRKHGQVDEVVSYDDHLEFRKIREF